MSGKKAKKPKKTFLRDKADKLFSEYIRKKYAGFDERVSCYTCGKVAHWYGEGMQCGHYVSRSKMSTRYDEDNARVQCYGCNVARSGNYPIYSERLMKESGVGIIEDLNERGRKLVNLDEKWYEDIIEDLQKKLDLGA